jgi:hypothetical protein
MAAGVWGPDQTVSITLHNNPGAGSYGDIEVEILLRLTFNNGANSVTGYEVDIVADTDSTGRIFLVGLDGTNGAFTVLANPLVSISFANGDVFKAIIAGKLIKVFQNGVQVGSTYDTSSDAHQYSTGAPGMGFWDAGLSGTSVRTDFCISQFTADDGLSPGPGFMARPRYGVGPRRRLMKPQRYADTYPVLVVPAALLASGRARRIGPASRFRLPQRYPDVALNAYILPAAQGSYTLSGQAAPLQHNDDLSAAQGAYVLTGEAASLLHGHLVSAAEGAYSLTGFAATFLRAYALSATQGTYVLSGKAATLAVGRVASANQGVYTISGEAVTFLRAYVLSAGSGAYVLTGQSATLIYSGATAPSGVPPNPFIAGQGVGMTRRGG